MQHLISPTRTYVQMDSQVIGTMTSHHHWFGGDIFQKESKVICVYENCDRHKRQL